MYKWAICPVENGELLERVGRKASDLRTVFSSEYLVSLNTSMVAGLPRRVKFWCLFLPLQILTILRISQVQSAQLEEAAQVAVVYRIS